MTEKTYRTIITDAGSALLASCILDGTNLEITEAAAGDGGGAYCAPDKTQTALVNECWRGGILSAAPNAATPGMLDIKIQIPADAGGFTVREAGLFTADGTLVAVCNMPDTEKPAPGSGASGNLTLLLHILVKDASVLEVAIEPSLDAVNWEQVEAGLARKQDKLTGEAGQVPVFNASGVLEAQDFSGSAVTAFTEADWQSDGADGYKIVLTAEMHKRKTADFGFQTFHLLDGRYAANTWAALGTEVRFDTEAQTVTLQSSRAYPGKILFVG